MRYNDSPLTRIHETHPLADPLRYPIALINGEPGWSDDLKKTDGRRITPKMFYAYMTMNRGESKHDYRNRLHNCGRAFQEYVIDAFMKMQLQRTRWLKNPENQKHLRADKYKSLRTNTAAAFGGREGHDHDADNLANQGRKLILPATYQGSFRFYNAKYQVRARKYAIAQSIPRRHLAQHITANKYTHAARTMLGVAIVLPTGAAAS